MKIGSVLIVGGGIAGMQSSLDLAESGFKVYLLESSPAIGGKMVQLDKTFPTGDCAMCTIAPRLVECGRHRNIEIITSADVEKVEGESGNFKVIIKKYPSYVDKEKCNACGDCEKECPVEVESEFDYGLSKRKAIYKLYPQAIPNLYTIDKQEVSPCRLNCPAGINAHGYIALIRAGKYKEALDLIREVNPFPGVCGRVCTHPCESECTRKEIDEPIAICALKRFVADLEYDNKSKIKNGERLTINGERDGVAIVGSGPAGLTCAYHLAKMGYKVTVFEALPVSGGMLRIGIPDFRLPPEVVDKEIEFIKNTGVEIKTNIAVGRDISFDNLRKQYKAIFISVGSPKSKRLKIEGEDLEGVYHGIDFLMNVKFDKKVKVGDKVIVLGGGNTALDAARTALRLGAGEVTIVYRRSREEMPAIPGEIEQTEKEGVKIRILTGPIKINGFKGKVTSLNYIKMKLGEPDASGRRRPVPVEGTEAFLYTDMVIIAIGQYADISFLPDELKDEKGNIKVNTETLDTSVSGIFAGGDVVSGPDILINAIAAGRKAAISIDRYLKGEKLTPVVLKPSSKKVEPDLVGRAGSLDPAQYERSKDRSLPLSLQNKKGIEQKKRMEIPRSQIEERISGFCEVELPLTEQMVRKEAERCLNCGICSECMECVKVCEPKAINHGVAELALRPILRELNVGSIILAPGFETFDARLKGEYGYGRYKDVITSIEFERILSASGPYGGEIRRLSDGKVPQKIAFIQCVGSRDATVNRDYCSAVCCMYTAKEAIFTKEHLPEAEITVFFIDIRAYGKGFEAYYERAKNEYGIKYVRCMVSKVSKHPKTGKLRIKYINDYGDKNSGRAGSLDPANERSKHVLANAGNRSLPCQNFIMEEDFDLVVLAVGLQPSVQTVELSKKLGIELTPYNFCSTRYCSPLATSKEGVFVAGVFQSPKDIPEAVMQASGSASEAAGVLSSVRNTLTINKEYPPEKDISKEKERIGVFICHCGRNIASVIDVEKIAAQVKKLPNVVHSETNLFTCAPDGLEKIRKAIEEHGLNRVVVASCTPRTHEVLFQENLREAGLNPYLFEMANIRDQCSWVHSLQPDKATLKARKLVQMAVAKARYLEPLKTQLVPVMQKALIIGGGLSGMVSALSLSKQGFEVYLIEKEKELGGNLRKIYYLLTTNEHELTPTDSLRKSRLWGQARITNNNPQEYLKSLIEKVRKNEKIHIYTETEIKEVSGFVGNFKSKIENRESKIDIEHGVVIVATGGEEYKPTEYLYGHDERILTQRELEEKISNLPRLTVVGQESPISSPQANLLGNLQSVVMLQCVGSRDETHPYCSRICCSEAIKNALKLKEINSEINIFILYRDIRTYGVKEIYYQKARDAGIFFIRYDEDKKPEVSVNGKRLTVNVFDSTLGMPITIDTDLVVLSTGIVPHASCEQVASLLKVPLNEDKFFQEAHIKLRPVDFATEGIFLCGLAHSPKFIDENISQAKASASRASTVLSKEHLEVGGVIAVVDGENCAACLTCIKVCPYNVPIIDLEGVAEIEPAKCQGCGTCVGECPAKAIQLQHFKDKQIIEQVISVMAL